MTELIEDTIFAPATVPGTGAITLIRMSGPHALEIADRLVCCGGDSPAVGAEDFPAGASSGGDSPAVGAEDFPAGASSGGDSPSARGDSRRKVRVPISSSRGYSIRFGRIHRADGSLLDEVLVSIFRAPHSYTGEDSVEITCHASSYIAGEISSMLVDLGARAAGPGEFTRRAFLNGKMDLAQAEAVADVIASESAAAHRIAVNQLKGGFSRELREMRTRLLEMVSLMELELDFSEEDVEFADRTRLDELVGKVLDHIERLSGSFRLGNAVRNGIPVAIAGATNVGKSTLLNALLGEDRAIVSDVHGTTRDTVEETLNVDGMLFRFIDTAGLRETSEAVERIGIERTWRKMQQADVILGLLDATRDEAVILSELDLLLDSFDPQEQKLFIVLNKCDDLDGSWIDWMGGAGGIVEGVGKAVADGVIEGVGKAVADGFSEVSAGNKNVNTLNMVVSRIENKGFGKGSVQVCPISARSGHGIDRLKKAVSISQRGRLLEGSSSTLVTNLRHYEALTAAAAPLRRVREGLATALPTDLVAMDLREAIRILGTITGEISTDEVLGSIFRNFCIGK